MKERPAEWYIQGLKNGDSKAIKEIMDICLPMVERYVKSAGGNREDAKDVLSYGMEVLFLKAEVETLYPGAKISTIVMAICMNRWRKMRKRNPPFSELKSEHDKQGEDNGDAEQELYELMKRIEDQIPNLAEDCQRLLHLSFHKKLKMKEVAEEMGITYGYARTRKFDCLARLRKLVNEDGKKRDE